ncbi:MAG: PSK operon transcription factor [Alphaproteobacteria bacterium]|nr:PSK operon transcription factor [Alphaproteobacteria bacterium]
MALNIKNSKAEKLAAQLAQRLGTTKTDAIIRALEEKIARERPMRAALPQRDRLEAIIARVSRRRVRDDRSAEEILGYDASGLPR